MTNKNLTSLFASIGIDISKPKKLFFTNAILGMHNPDEAPKEDVALLGELIKIIKPKVVITLGRVASNCIFKTTENLPYKRELDENTMFFARKLCAGAVLRKTPINKQIEEWEEIGKYLRDNDISV